MRRRMAAIALAVMSILVVSAVPARAETPPDLKLVSAEVLARGAAARLTFDVRCNPGAGEFSFGGWLSVTLAQPGTGRRAASTGLLTFEELWVAPDWGYPGCPSDVRRVSVLILPEPGASAFERGRASTRALLRRCTSPSAETPERCEDVLYDFNIPMRTGQAIPPTLPADPLRLVSATLDSNGQAARVVVAGAHGGCDFDPWPYRPSVRALISQRVGNTTTQSRVELDATPCPASAGSFQRTLVVPVQTGQDLFRANRAFIQVQFNPDCRFPIGCNWATVENITKVTKQPT